MRHQHGASVILHAVGIPMAIGALVLAGVQVAADAWGLWWRPVVLIVGGYALQWVGHRLEGNDMGEVIVLKRWLGWSYTAVAPRYVSETKTSPRVAHPNDSITHQESCSE